MSKDGKTGKDKDENSIFGNDSLAESFDASARPIVTVDVNKYQSWLDDSGLSEEKKEEFLQALWSIVVAFVEIGFGVHPLQEVCAQNSETFSQRPKEGFDLVSSNRLDETENVEDSGSMRGLEVE
jgi:hypothetical protein